MSSAPAPSLYATAPRADIQGLRAFAALAVIFYHAGLATMPGGYVGVDIFFVLSGFLITRKLYREVDESGSLNLWRFIADRAKRLLPNAALVLLATLVATALLLPPFRHGEIAADIRAAALFVSNFHFAANAVDYLRLDARPSPVMHFWSLSVEEQFYLVWPLLLLALVLRFRQRALRFATPCLLAIAVLSFALSLAAIAGSQPQAYFQTQNRIWQLAVGGLVGVWFHHRHRLPAPLRAALVHGGFAGCLWAIGWFSEATRYPGLWALAPTLGMAAILIGLEARGAGMVRAGLSTRAMTWLGDRSYSLYLWHWPIFVIGEAIWGRTPALSAALLLATLLAAAMAYRFVEYPLHRAAWRPRVPWQGAVMSLACGVVLAGLSYVLPPLFRPAWATARLAEIAVAERDFGTNYADGCHLGFRDVTRPPCVYGAAEGRDVVLFGDSHAAQWFEPLRRAAEREGWRLRTLTKTSCPSADVTIWYPPRRATYVQCDAWRRRSIAELRAAPPRIVFIANYAHYTGWIQDRQNGAVLHDTDAAAEWQAGMQRTLTELVRAGTQVVLIRDNPVMEADYRECLSQRRDCGRERAAALRGVADDAAVLRALPEAVRLLDFSDTVCGTAVCPAELDGRIIYQDRHHFTASYTRTLWQHFAELLRQMDKELPTPSVLH